MTVTRLTFEEVKDVSGVGTVDVVGSCGACAGGIIAIAGTDGALALLGLGVATGAACYSCGYFIGSWC